MESSPGPSPAQEAQEDDKETLSYRLGFITRSFERIRADNVGVPEYVLQLGEFAFVLLAELVESQKLLVDIDNARLIYEKSAPPTVVKEAPKEKPLERGYFGKKD